MSEAPPFDGRSEEELVAVSEALASSFTGWKPTPEDDLDLGGAMVRLFGRLARRAVEAVDQTPGHLAGELFRLLGVRPQPPGVARAPLVFAPVDGAGRDPLVPIDSEVAAPADDLHPEATSFYTERDLTVLRTPITAVRVVDPITDSADDVSLHALPAMAEEAGITPLPWHAFDARTAIDRALYIACDALLAHDPPDNIVLTITGGDAPWPASNSFVFETWSGEAWIQAPVSDRDQQGAAAEFTVAPQMFVVREVAGLEAVWLRMRVEERFAVGEGLPSMTDVSLTAVRLLSDRPPVKVVRGLFVLDTTAEFAPFDKVPEFNAALLIDGGEAFVQPAGAEVTVDYTVSAWHPTANPVDVVLAYELLMSDGWQAIGYAHDDGVAGAPQGATRLADHTRRFRESGQVAFTLPGEVPLAVHNGHEGRWLRVRMVKGHYGEQSRLTVVDATPTMTADTLAPPWLSRIRLTSSSSQSLTASGGQVRLARTVAGFTRLDPPLGSTPFPPVEVTEKTLWIGFDQPVGNAPVAMHIDVLPPVADTVTGLLPRNPDWDPEDPPRLVWEASTAEGWIELVVDDDTHALSKPGIVRFLAPYDGVMLDRFGATAQWIRVRWAAGSYHHPPRIGTIRLNAVYARAATAVAYEVIGSGTGGIEQLYAASRTPILAGEVVEIREETDGPWIRWMSVPDFNGSGPKDRHYTLDPESGEVAFGTGRRGAPPPKGENNIRISYVTGGGAEGNREAGAITQPRSAMPLVDSVFNPAPAEGGRDAYMPDVVAGEVPRTLRHRDRAVAVADFADLAREASDSVFRVAVITPDFTRDNPVTFDVETKAVGRGGWVKDVQGAETASGAAHIGFIEVVVVPFGTEARPNPSQALLDTVHHALAARADASVDLRVTGPRWAAVTVTAELGSTAAEAARVIADATAALDRYLHPLTGGVAGDGWPFGRRPRDSDIQAVLAEVEGVHFVRKLSVDCRPLLPLPEFVGVDRDIALDELSHREAQSALVATGDHRLTVVEAR